MKETEILQSVCLNLDNSTQLVPVGGMYVMGIFLRDRHTFDSPRLLHVVFVVVVVVLKVLVVPELVPVILAEI